MKLRRLALCAGAFAGALYLTTFTAACDDEEVGADGVVYQGGATDEALDALISADTKQDESKAAKFEAPTVDEVIAGDSPFTFEWLETGASASVDPLRFMPKEREHGVFERALGVVLQGTPVAHAHGDPISGPAYYLVFTNEAQDELVRVFTTNTDYRPGDDEWARLKGAEGTVSARLTWAQCETTRVTEGPWEGKALTFSIQ